MADNEPWVPTSKADWAEVFAEGMGLHETRREQAAREAAEAKAKADAEDAAKNGGGAKTGDTAPVPPRSLGDILLGGRRSDPSS